MLGNTVSSFCGFMASQLLYLRRLPTTHIFLFSLETFISTNYTPSSPPFNYLGDLFQTTIVTITITSPSHHITSNQRITLFPTSLPSPTNINAAHPRPHPLPGPTPAIQHARTFR